MRLDPIKFELSYQQELKSRVLLLGELTDKMKDIYLI